jgi:hypothetical protein
MVKFNTKELRCSQLEQDGKMQNQYLNITQELMDMLEDIEADEMLKQLNESCKSIESHFWYRTDDTNKSDRICNLCHHYNLLHGTCKKHGGYRKIDDTCKDWERCQ